MKARRRRRLYGVDSPDPKTQTRARSDHRPPPRRAAASGSSSHLPGRRRRPVGPAQRAEEGHADNAPRDQPTSRAAEGLLRAAACSTARSSSGPASSGRTPFAQVRRPRPQPVRLLDLARRRRHQGARSTARRTSTATRSSTASARSTTCTPRCSTCSASTTSSRPSASVAATCAHRRPRRTHTPNFGVARGARHPAGRGERDVGAVAARDSASGDAAVQKRRGGAPCERSFTGSYDWASGRRASESHEDLAAGATTARRRRNCTAAEASSTACRTSHCAGGSRALVRVTSGEGGGDSATGVISSTNRAAAPPAAYLMTHPSGKPDPATDCRGSRRPRRRRRRAGGGGGQRRADSVLLLLLAGGRGGPALHVVHLDHGARRPGRPTRRSCATWRAHGVAATVALRDVEPTLAARPANASSQHRACRLALFRRAPPSTRPAGVILAHHADDVARQSCTACSAGRGRRGWPGSHGGESSAG